MAKGQKSSSGGSKSRKSSGEGESDKSIGAIVSQNLGQENTEGLERVMEEVKQYFDRSREYVAENPKEAAGLAIAVGFAAWALLGTKPGRTILEAGAAYAVPEITKWFSRNIHVSMGLGGGEAQMQGSH